MYHYGYVSRKQAKPYRQEFQNILFELQDLVRDDFTFQFQFIGSSARNMITFDSTTNIGFDFDVNIEVNDRNDEYSPEEIRHIIIEALNKIITRQGFNYVENGTRVLTIKKVNSFLSKIQYSCDIAIVNNYIDRKDGNHQEYVRYIKAQNTYIWAEQTSPYDLEEKIKAIKKHNLWNDVRKLYLYKKNYNTDKNKKSRNLYAETIKEIHDRI